MKYAILSASTTNIDQKQNVIAVPLTNNAFIEAAMARGYTRETHLSANSQDSAVKKFHDTELYSHIEVSSKNMIDGFIEQHEIGFCYTEIEDQDCNIKHFLRCAFSTTAESDMSISQQKEIYLKKAGLTYLRKQAVELNGNAVTNVTIEYVKRGLFSRDIVRVCGCVKRITVDTY